MKLHEALKLMESYAVCPKCGNEYLGKDDGSLEIDDTFKRTCKCGWSIVVKSIDE